MKTILVPTDFSELSNVALRYAVQVAAQLKAQITLVSVVNVNTTSQTLMKWQKLEEEMVEIAEQDAERIINEIKNEFGDAVKIRFQALKGFPVEMVLDRFAIEQKVALIIMGTRGATGVKKTFLGSNATAVVDHSSVPVLVVPGDAEFKGVKRIVYATDFDNLDAQLKTIIPYGKFFDAEISILHVASVRQQLDSDVSGKLENLKKQLGYPALSFHVVKNDHIADAVELFCKDVDADMLALFTHKLDFYEKLFGKSVTQQLAFHAKLPLLTFNKTMLK
jgi:nucleotide-binding universal stress UspA family protein